MATSKALTGASVALLVVSGAAPSIWRALDRYQALGAASSLGIANAPSLPAGVFLVALVLLALGAAAALVARRGHAWGARAVFALGIAVAVGSVSAAFTEVAFGDPRMGDGCVVEAAEKLEQESARVLDVGGAARALFIAHGERQRAVVRASPAQRRVALGH